MHSIDADFTKTFLFPPAIEDFVPSDHPARFIREFVEVCLSGEKVKLEWREENGEGRPPYAAALLFRVWLYAYLNGITSTRKVEAACRDQVGMMWLAGLHTPDHNTLWRFWKANRKTIRQVFRQSVQLAWEAGMVSMTLHAVDGTKIQARASTRRTWRRKELEKFLSHVDQKIAALEQILEGEGDAGQSYQIPPELQDARALKALITDKLKTLDQVGRDQYNPADPEAESMKTGSGNRLAYNAQIAVEESNTVIVAETTITSPADQGQLTPVMDLVEDQLGRTADQTVADGGYNTEQTLVEADEAGREITLAAGPADGESNPDKPYHASRFIYDAHTDSYECPRGEKLTFDEKKYKGHGRVVRVYRSAACASCPVVQLCARSGKSRSIERSPHQELVDANRQRRRSPEGRARLKRRAAVVERVFACMKTARGFVRFTFHGLANVAAQWSWLCTAHNLRILYARWAQETRRMLCGDTYIRISPHRLAH